MNIYTSCTITNVAICICVLAIAYFTGSAWALVGLIYLNTVESSKD